VDKVALADPSKPVYVAVVGDSLFRHIFFAFGVWLGCLPKDFNFAYLHHHMGCFGTTPKGTPYAVMFNFLNGLNDTEAVDLIDNELGSVWDGKFLGTRKLPAIMTNWKPRYLLTYAGHHDHKMGAMEFRNATMAYVQNLAGLQKKGGNLERVGLSTTCAAISSRSRNLWFQQTNARISFKNDLFREVYEELTSSPDSESELGFEISGMMDWYHASLAAMRDTLTHDSLHFVRENIYRQWAFEMLHAVMFPQR
jgi:hypothetical protein